MLRKMFLVSEDQMNKTKKQNPPPPPQKEPKPKNKRVIKNKIRKSIIIRNTTMTSG
jgi:hypothetical protein